jgi:hypothetical protein
MYFTSYMKFMYVYTYWLSSPEKQEFYSSEVYPVEKPHASVIALYEPTRRHITRKTYEALSQT